MPQDAFARELAKECAPDRLEDSPAIVGIPDIPESAIVHVPNIPEPSAARGFLTMSFEWWGVQFRPASVLFT